MRDVFVGWCGGVGCGTYEILRRTSEEPKNVLFTRYENSNSSRVVIAEGLQVVGGDLKKQKNISFEYLKSLK